MSKNELEDALSHAIYNKTFLEEFIMKQAKHALTEWDNYGCQLSKMLLAHCHTLEHFQKALAGMKPQKRNSLDNTAFLQNPTKCVGYICTSGSSGYPLKYGISSNWRKVHHLVWNLAYLKMTEGALNEYLDPRFIWAMARAPGAPADNLPNLIECIPTRNGIDFKNLLKPPFILHGSATTIIEMLEYEKVRKWKPEFVIFTYEKPSNLHIQLIKDAWPRAKVHYEYASNDGGSSAFTCPYEQMHFWMTRSIPTKTSGLLRVTDIWNEATSFIAYECGDNVEWLDDTCKCGSAFPLIKIHGREAGVIILENGSKISQLCPFDDEQLENIKAIKILVKQNNTALVKIVPLNHTLSHLTLSLLRTELFKIGFEKVNFELLKSFKELREQEKKFKVVIDTRREADAKSRI